MDYIDIDTWPRKALFHNYLGTDFPYIILGADLEVTHLYNYAKQNDLSFYFSMVYAANEIADRIENFHFRFTEGQPYRIEHNCPVITHLQPGSDLFVLVEAARAGNIAEFCRQTAQKAGEKIVNHGLASLHDRNDTIIYSTVPWIRFTSLVRTVARDGVDCAPKISWGKFEKQEGRIVMPFSVQVHHGLMDGYHVGCYFQQLQSYLDTHGWL